MGYLKLLTTLKVGARDPVELLDTKGQRVIPVNPLVARSQLAYLRTPLQECPTILPNGQNWFRVHSVILLGWGPAIHRIFRDQVEDRCRSASRQTLRREQIEKLIV